MSTPNQTTPSKPPLAIVQQKREAASFLDSKTVKEAVAKVLPKHVTPDRLVRVAMTAVMGKPELAQACASEVGKASLLDALMRCSQAGLEPDGRLAHLIPFWNAKANAYCVQVIFDYKGLVTLARRSGIDAKAILVHEHDKFEYIEDDGTGHTVVHHTFNPLADRGAIIGCYSRAVENGKAPDYEVMSIKEIEAIRERSRAKDSGPWKTDYGEMVKKTPLRRHSKRWELQPEVRAALTADDDTPIDIVTTAAPSKPIFQALPPPTTNGNAPAEPPKTNGTINKIKELCAKSSIEVPKLISFLVEIGAATPGVDSLEQLHIENETVLPMILDQWASISERILKGEQPNE